MARWDQCIEHRGDDTSAFVTEYFGQPDRRVLLIAGAGFDPRAVAVCESLASVSTNLRTVLLREERPGPAQELVDRAETNLKQFYKFDQHLSLIPVQILGSDNAAVGGRNAVHAVRDAGFGDATDIVVDLSALSMGTSYPIVRYLYESLAGDHTRNIHVFLASDPPLDEAIRPVASDTVSFVHGFKGQWAIDSMASAAKLWLPQLARGRNAALNRIHAFLSPHDTCPILPFPSSRPRQPDELVEGFLVELESTWEVDTRNVIHASDDDPLDLYRTILRIDDLRKPVFAEVGSSLLILSPMGTKVLALGALLAALERDLPVAYLEAVTYEVVSAPPTADQAHFIHLWLSGDAYTGVGNES